MKNSKVKFSNQQSLVDFLISKGAKTGKRFFVVEGTDVTGRVSNKVEELSAELRVSLMEPEDGEASHIIHLAGDGSDANTLSTFSR